MRDLPNLDLLRTLAVLSVVAEHTLLAYRVDRLGPLQVPWLGVVGVFLFFIHTSLVLLWSLERRPHTLDFYIRRIFRIYPLAITAAVITLALHAPVCGSPTAYFHFQAPSSRSTLLGALLLIPNLIGNYLPMSVMWSLPYEVEMYVCLPLLFFFLQRNLSLWPLLLFWGLTMAACRTAFPGVAHNFFLVIPYFLPGAMAYVGFSRHRARLPAWLFVPALLVVWAVFLRNPGWRRADGLCLAVGLGLPLFHQIRTLWLQTVSREIAKYSYGLYLAHPFSIVLGLYLLPHRPLPLQLSVMAVSLIAFTVTSFHLIEKPMMRLGSRLAQRAEHRYEQGERGNLRIAEADIR